MISFKERYKNEYSNLLNKEKKNCIYQINIQKKDSSFSFQSKYSSSEYLKVNNNNYYYEKESIDLQEIEWE